jgi:DNA invertase Pin-like site-specific DNA recombinase
MVIDEDLGRSAANAAERPAFARLVAEITMGARGLVLGPEMRRPVSSVTRPSSSAMTIPGAVSR